MRGAWPHVLSPGAALAARARVSGAGWWFFPHGKWLGQSSMLSGPQPATARIKVKIPIVRREHYYDLPVPSLAQRATCDVCTFEFPPVDTRADARPPPSRRRGGPRRRWSPPGAQRPSRTDL